jgi:hypothetical protein
METPIPPPFVNATTCFRISSSMMMEAYFGQSLGQQRDLAVLMPVRSLDKEKGGGNKLIRLSSIIFGMTNL